MLKNVLFCFAAAASAVYAGDEQAVRDLIAKRLAAYHNLDAKTLASVESPDFQFIDRFGDNIQSEGPAYNERMWSWAFREVYKKNPPEHKMLGVRFLTPDVAVAQSTVEWPALKLEDGTGIPPHGEIDTYTVVRRDGRWLIAVQTIHNRFGQGVGDHPDFDKPLSDSR